MCFTTELEQETLMEIVCEVILRRSCCRPKKNNNSTPNNVTQFKASHINKLFFSPN